MSVRCRSGWKMRCLSGLLLVGALSGCPSSETGSGMRVEQSESAEVLVEERDRHLESLWRLWQEDFRPQEGAVELERAGFERRVRTAGSGEDVRDLRRDVRAFFAEEEVRSLSERVVEIERLLTLDGAPSR